VAGNDSFSGGLTAIDDDAFGTVPLQISSSRGKCGTVAASPSDDDFELLGNGGIWIVGLPRLSFSHHVDHFDPAKRSDRTCEWLEAEHGPHTTPMRRTGRNS
jgi:hypothetical protein